MPTLDDLNGRGLLTRLLERDLDTVDVGDFIDAVLDGEEPGEHHLAVLDEVASAFRSAMSSQVHNGVVSVWRHVQVHGDLEAWAASPVGPDGGLGLCWSCDASGARPYGAADSRGAPRLLQGSVEASEVDWAASCIMNTVKPDQAEARLLPSASVTITGIHDGRAGQALPCPCLGQRFPAAHGGPDAAARSSFDMEEVVATLLQEISQYELTSPDDYIDDYADHCQATLGKPPSQAVMDDPLRSKAFKAWLPGEIERRAREKLEGLRSLMSDGGVRAWRAVVADADWVPGRDRHVGCHWTYTRDKAIAYDAEDGSHLHVVEAVIPDASIDWTETVIHHLTRDVDEDEITVLAEAPVEVLDVLSTPAHGTLPSF